MKQRTILLMLVAVAVAAGCSSEDSTPTIPSSRDVVTTSTSAETTTTVAARLGFEDAVLEFTECMRDEGIDLPDIRLDADGRPVLGEVMGDIDLADEGFRSALQQCAPILSRAGALELSADPELQAVIIDQLASFSACMRTNGVESFPDPSPGYSGTGSPYPLGKTPFDDPEFESAATTCQAELGSLGLD